LVTGAKLNCHGSTIWKPVRFEIWCFTGDRNPLRATPREILNGHDAQADSVSCLASGGLT
jgi:hypothetical protein